MSILVTEYVFLLTLKKTVAAWRSMAQAVMLLSLLALDPPAAALLPSSKACPRTAAKAIQNGDLMEVNTIKNGDLI
jgi:hypothetical protein